MSMKSTLQAMYQSIEKHGWSVYCKQENGLPGCFIGHQGSVFREEPFGRTYTLDYLRKFVSIKSDSVSIADFLSAENLREAGIGKVEALAILTTAIAALPGDEDEENLRQREPAAEVGASSKVSPERERLGS